jgi:hypothetical protein
MTYDVGNTGPGLRQAQQCGRVKPVNYLLSDFHESLPLLPTKDGLLRQVVSQKMGRVMVFNATFNKGQGIH